MNILIVTPFYKHDRNIASVRWTNIATRLAKRHNVIVVTQPHDDMDMAMAIETDEDGILVARLNQKTAYETFAVKHFGAATGDDWQTSSNSKKASATPHEGFVRKAKNRVLFASMKQKAKQYAKQIIKGVIPKDTKIDVVISSACPFIEMLFGYELKKRLGCKWISDFRDLPFYENNRDDTRLMKRVMNRVLPQAEAIMVVVPSMAKRLVELTSVQPKKVHVISNGFSKTDFCSTKEAYNDGRLHLGFTGSLYTDGSECNVLFEALKECKQQDATFDFVIDCAGGNSYLIGKQAKKFGLQDHVNCIGFVSREEALALQRKADCLLIFISVERAGFGAKIFEYMLSQKPIVNIVYGDKMGGDDAKLFIKDLNLGVSVNEASKTSELPLLIEYLCMQLNRKREGRALLYEPSKDKMNEYDHDHLIAKIEAIINSITE